MENQYARKSNRATRNRYLSCRRGIGRYGDMPQIFGEVTISPKKGQGILGYGGCLILRHLLWSFWLEEEEEEDETLEQRSGTFSMWRSFCDNFRMHYLWLWHIYWDAFPFLHTSSHTHTHWATEDTLSLTHQQPERSRILGYRKKVNKTFSPPPTTNSACYSLPLQWPMH